MADGETIPETTAFPDGFEEYRRANPDLFPDDAPRERQIQYYLALIEREANSSPEPEPTAPCQRTHREWKIVVNNTALSEQTGIALDAIADQNDPPFIFNRARSLSRVVFDENDNPCISMLTEAGVRGVLERCVNFIKLDKAGFEVVAYPPEIVVKDLMALPEWLTIPAISGIAECPIVSSDGKIITRQGYDRGTRLYYAPAPGLMIPTIPNDPTASEVDEAVHLIQEIFVDFPFVDDASRAGMIAALMTAVLRPMIPGPVPMAIIDKPQAGTGATLLSEVIALVATGRPAALMTAPEDDAAWRKAITSTLSAGRGLAIVDNIEVKLFAPSLAAVLTSNIWTDRILGRSEMITLPHNIFWICTGNNTMLGGDLPRRCFWVRLDAQTARPWQRTDYLHPDLLGWVEDRRGYILSAILTLARAWIRAGRPKPDSTVPRMGSFEGWRDVVGGILTLAKIPGFLGNLEAMYELADADGPQWQRFFSMWFQKFPGREKTVSELITHLDNEGNSTLPACSAKDGTLLETLPDILAEAWSGKKNFPRVLGKQLSKMNGRVFLLCGMEERLDIPQEIIFQKGRTSHKVGTWIVYEKTRK